MRNRINRLFNRTWNHLKLFAIPWLVFVAMMLVALFVKGQCKTVLLTVLMIAFVLALIKKPMNIIHGMIGTRGDISNFFLVFLLINFFFSGIYYFSYFKDSGITYDLSQPHIEFKMFDHDKRLAKENDPRKGMEMIPSNCPDTSHYYHRIQYQWVLQNTFLTSLMQEPTEFYSFTCTYNGNHDENDDNKRIARNFHWFLVFHILISWILLGVFISLIYQKFRNN